MSKNEYNFVFTVETTYNIPMYAENLAKAMHMFKNWWQECGDVDGLDGVEVTYNGLRTIECVMKEKIMDDGEPTLVEVYQDGDAIPKGGCIFENCRWVNGE